MLSIHVHPTLIVYNWDDPFRNLTAIGEYGKVWITKEKGLLILKEKGA